MVAAPSAYVPPQQQTYSPPPPPSAITQADLGQLPDRVHAAWLGNPGTTVAKGTLIPAVLETALDSTRPGFARATVSRNVNSFDGSRVLIPRGSRLVGEYKADLGPGQKRAQIIWQRLVRPDGAMIYLDSPAADKVGQAGVEGKVDTHFLARFSGAILQTVLSIGSQAAVNRIAGGSVVVAVPNAGQAAGAPTTDRVQPTLKVRQGTSVSVFVAKDLDFSSVEQ